MNERMTDEQVEQEIENLRKSPYVKLAKKAEYIRNQRRQRMYMLRYYDKKGRSMAEAGITMEMLDMLAYIQEQKEKTGALRTIQTEEPPTFTPQEVYGLK